jgi:hypothetical protein
MMGMSLGCYNPMGNYPLTSLALGFILSFIYGCSGQPLAFELLPSYARLKLREVVFFFEELPIHIFIDAYSRTIHTVFH